MDPFEIEDFEIGNPLSRTGRDVMVFANDCMNCHAGSCEMHDHYARLSAKEVVDDPNELSGS
ncbi:uncharacterized protein K452DRAFT_292501 [Aplosporella prunicola CBS 121167]|uniref:Uncharacterized protein n=1 Tax=Aplosporella prunicola CBS 121167 TaxID=1176127 RepID=A0A6A6AZC7_9PEZI|nr:uncharacterized protein K452DRAFT_292501 [Aplosporella prunicola CBS 121167]KAF2136305.1 hypothetical protein K452DRAFT_292501 [Aplosporella prunicola CBS 121167]